jgi:hypothetical protein
MTEYGYHRRHFTGFLWLLFSASAIAGALTVIVGSLQVLRTCCYSTYALHLTSSPIYRDLTSTVTIQSIPHPLKIPLHFRLTGILAD